MTCDCEALAAAIAIGEATVIVRQAALSVAQQQLQAAQTQLWYDQYNFYLCGCGGEGFDVAKSKEHKVLLAEVRKAIIDRNNNAEEMAVLKQFPAMYRMHMLVMAQIEAEPTTDGHGKTEETAQRRVAKRE